MKSCTRLGEGAAHPRRTQGLRGGARCIFHTHSVSGPHATLEGTGAHWHHTSGHTHPVRDPSSIGALSKLQLGNLRK